MIDPKRLNDLRYRSENLGFAESQILSMVKRDVKLDTLGGAMIEVSPMELKLLLAAYDTVHAATSANAQEPVRQ